MKNILIICIFGFPGYAFAQKIHFTDTSNIWKEAIPTYNAPSPAIVDYYIYSFINDSTIDSFTYQNFGFGYVREDTLLNKVFIRDTTGDSDIVLMNYNLHIGDTFAVGNNLFPVIATDSTLINGVSHKVWGLLLEATGIYSYSDTIYIVEGIGCLPHPTYLLWNLSSCIECYEPVMYCFSNKGITPPLIPQVAWLDNSTSCIVYSEVTQLTLNTEAITIYPNPTFDILTIKSSTLPISQIIITNILGQTINCKLNNVNTEHIEADVSGLTAGIYFIRVNNILVKRFVKEAN